MFLVGDRVVFGEGFITATGEVRGYTTLSRSSKVDPVQTYLVVELDKGDYLLEKKNYVSMMVVHPDNARKEKASEV